MRRSCAAVVEEAVEFVAVIVAGVAGFGIVVRKLDRWIEWKYSAR